MNQPIMMVAASGGEILLGNSSAARAVVLPGPLPTLPTLVVAGA